MISEDKQSGTHMNHSITATTLQPFTDFITEKIKRSGYDLDVDGRFDNRIYSIHGVALSCIFMSFMCAIVVGFLAFRQQDLRTFFHWSKSERFVVYLALCDALFNLCHALDHSQILITRDHVRPHGLCVFYSIMLIEFMSAQVILVNLTCLNAFVLVFFEKNWHFGRCDWKLLTVVFGAPAIAAATAAGCGVLGPNGVSCYFDEVKGKVVGLYYTTLPVFVVLVVNSILYTLTWWNIRTKEPKFRNPQDLNKVSRASHRAARNMTLFAVAFVIQWWSLPLYGIWELVYNKRNEVIRHITTAFVNIGGLLNLIVFLVIRRRKILHWAHGKAMDQTLSALD